MNRSNIAGGLLLGLALAGCATVPRLPPRDPYDPDCLLGGEVVTVPLINQRNYQWQVNAVLNGVPGVFILDTGADHTLITPQFARKTGLGAQSGDGRFAKGNGRPGTARSAWVNIFRLGDADYTGFYAPIVDLDHIQRAVNTEIAGILGNNVLNQTAWQIDGPRNLLTLKARSTTPPPGSVRIAPRQGRIMVPVLINGRAAEFAVDTGAYRSTLAAKELRRLKIPREKQTEAEAPRIDIHSAQVLKLTDVLADRLEAGPILRTNYALRVWDHNTLGMDLLAPWVLDVDARQGWISLTEPAAPGRE